MRHIIVLLSWLSAYLTPIISQEIKRDNRVLLENDIVFDIFMPKVQPQSFNKYLCIAVKIDTDEAYITQFEPHAKASRAHHMILFGSSSSPELISPDYWDCSKDYLGGKQILFAWAKNAPPVKLPEGVGIKVGKKTNIHYLILQVHYARILQGTDTDSSGFRLVVTGKRQKYLAGMFIMSDSTAVIPAGQPSVHVDVSCNPSINQPIHVFAYRVHTHELGYAVTSYRFNTQNSSWDLLFNGNPKWPQAIYPINSVFKVTQDDVLVTRCSYNSSSRQEDTHMGRGTKDEMCNSYLMYYIEDQLNDQKLSLAQGCQGNSFPRLVMQLPKDSSNPLPVNRAMLEQARSDEIPQSISQLTLQDISIRKKGDSPLIPDDSLSADYDTPPVPTTPAFDDSYQYKEVVGWPGLNFTLGQVTAVSINAQGHVVIFHRGSHVWGGRSFDWTHRYLQQDEGPIPEDTILILDPSTGHVINKWGRNMFYMPHGLTIDNKGFAWLTDVALHQILKFKENGSTTAELILGERFVPGKGEYNFCKPTSVAIANSGDFYVADGYCNARIIKFSPNGKYISQWGNEDPIYSGNPIQPPPGSFLIPHKVILAAEESLVCVADRENGRIQCFDRSNHAFAFEILRDEFHGKLFSVAATPGRDALLYAVCGRSATGYNHSVQAFVFNLTNQVLLNVVTPRQGTFSQPHDLAVTPDTEAMYVAEIGPNIIWKFKRALHKSSKKVLPAGQATNVDHQGEQLPLSDTTAVPSLAPKSEEAAGAGESIPMKMDNISSSEVGSLKPMRKASGVVTEASNFATSMVIMALLGIPILLLVLITVIVRLRKRGRFQQCSLPQVKGWLGGYRTPHGSHEKFNIGSLLNPHKGFDRVALDESDLEVEDKSDSDVEEFNAAATRRA